MSRRKSRPTIVPWLSARPDNQEKRFIQIGNSLLFSKVFQELHAGAQHLYFCMAMESGGKQEFQFPTSAAKKYGISPSSFWNYVQELTEKGFISYSSNQNLRKPNIYRFSMQWKLPSNTASLFRPEAMATYSKSGQKLDKTERIDDSLAIQISDKTKHN